LFLRTCFTSMPTGGAVLAAATPATAAETDDVAAKTF